MDFFQAQEDAKRRSFLLVLLFGAAVVGIIIAVYLVLVIFGIVTLGVGAGFDLGIFAVVAFGTGAVIGGGSFARTAQLRKGGPAVAEMMGARRVDPATRDRNEQQLVNVVEEMSIAAGMPVPAIYVMDDEPSINAFAAGYGIHDAAVAVTRGTLETMSRDELQGVIAHEFSHILNGDMRLNIRLIGLLFGILLLTVVGRGVLRGALRGGMMRGARRSGGNKGGGGVAAAVALGIALVVVGYIGVFFGKLIKAAVSRQREYLADAAAVQYTRNPQGIAGALRRIGAHAEGARIKDHHAEELSHLFFANGVGSALSQATATHPPLPDRIRRIDPSWDGNFEMPPRRDRPRKKDPEPKPEGEDEGWGFGPKGLTGLAAAAVLLGSVGDPKPEHVSRAGEILKGIPDPLREAAHEEVGAQALILALLGGTDEKSREARRGVDDDEVRAQLDRLEPLAAQLPPESRLPLVDLALPVLGRLDEARATAFRRTAEGVVRANGEMRSFDFALLHILWKHIAESEQPRRRGGREKSVKSVRNELRILLSALAWAGAEDEAEARAAFDEGLGKVRDATGDLTLAGESAVGLHEVDQALGRLERGNLDLRRTVLEAAAGVTLADGVLLVEEAELLRAVAECLELPLPPLMATKQAPEGR
jgi:Zn-dependent protease with chaperone function